MHAKASGSTEKPQDSKPKRSDFRLRSPLVRSIAKRVGLGQPAVLLQEASLAAVDEAGPSNVSRSAMALPISCGQKQGSGFQVLVYGCKGLGFTI